MEQRFLELAQNKDITDEELFDELCYSQIKSHQLSLHPSYFWIKKLRQENPSLSRDTLELNQLCEKIPLDPLIYNYNSQVFQTENYHHYVVEKYEMKKRIRSLEQTLKTFMEQTKAERLAQDATIQSLSKEMDEFQEEFYDCQSDLKEHVGLLENALQEAVENVLELHHLRDERDHLKYKMA